MNEETTKCRNEINAVLDRFQMMFDFQMILSAGSVEPVIRLVPKPQEKLIKEDKIIEAK